MKPDLRYIALVIPLFLSTTRASDIHLVLQQGNRGYEGTEDVSIASDGRVKDRNFGGRQMVHLWPEGDAIFIRFDLSRLPRTARVVKASLELSSQGAGFSQAEIDGRGPLRPMNAVMDGSKVAAATRGCPTEKS